MDTAQQAPSCPVGARKAMQFIQEVQRRFETSSRPELFQRFLQVLMDSYAPGTPLKPVEEAVLPIHEKMKGIFKDDKDLLEKFESFLPRNLAANPSGHTAKQGAAEQPELEGVKAEPVD